MTVSLGSTWCHEKLLKPPGTLQSWARSKVFLEASCLSTFIQSHCASGGLREAPIPAWSSWQKWELCSCSVSTLLHLACVSWGKTEDLLTPFMIPARAVTSLQGVPGPRLRRAGRSQLAPPLTSLFCPQAPAQQPNPKPGSQRL